MKRSIPFTKSLLGLILVPATLVSGIASAATLTVEFKTDEEAAADYEEVNLYVINTATATSLDDAIKFKSTEKSFTKTFEDLPAGSYFVLGFTGPFDQVNDASRPGAFLAQKPVELGAADAEETLTIEYVPLDSDEWKGNETASGRAVSLEGEPIAGIEISLGAMIETAGMLEIESATTDEDGYFEFERLAEGKTYALTASGDNPVGEIRAGGNVTLELPPQVGQEAPEIEFVHLESGDTQQLSDFDGKVVVLEFWASWCGPCQAPMEKMQTYREKHPDWGDKVELIALSIDNTKAAAEDHLKENGWNSTYNVWAGDGGFQAGAPEAYGIRGIPTVYLIDQNGKIAATGHPMALDMPSLVDGLLAK